MTAFDEPECSFQVWRPKAAHHDTSLSNSFRAAGINPHDARSLRSASCMVATSLALERRRGLALARVDRLRRYLLRVLRNASFELVASAAWDLAGPAYARGLASSRTRFGLPRTPALIPLPAGLVFVDRDFDQLIRRLTASAICFSFLFVHVYDGLLSVHVTLSQKGPFSGGGCTSHCGSRAQKPEISPRIRDGYHSPAFPRSSESSSATPTGARFYLTRSKMT
jgi:hypothetical protein